MTPDSASRTELLQEQARRSAARRVRPRARAHSRRHHHGRQRPLGREARPASASRVTRRAPRPSARRIAASIELGDRLPDDLLVLLGELDAARRRGLGPHVALRRGARARAHQPPADGRARAWSSATWTSLPTATREAFERVVRRRPPSNDGLTLVVALNYGGRVRDRRRPLARSRATPPPARSIPTSIDEATVRVAALHRRHSRSRPAHPHERGDARQQLPAVADRLQRAVGHSTSVAGLRPHRPAARGRRLSRSATAGSGAVVMAETSASSEPEGIKPRRLLARVLTAAAYARRRAGCHLVQPNSGSASRSARPRPGHGRHGGHRGVGVLRHGTPRSPGCPTRCSGRGGRAHAACCGALWGLSGLSSTVTALIARIAGLACRLRASAHHRHGDDGLRRRLHRLPARVPRAHRPRLHATGTRARARRGAQRVGQRLARVPGRLHARSPQDGAAHLAQEVVGGLHRRSARHHRGLGRVCRSLFPWVGVKLATCDRHRRAASAGRSSSATSSSRA